MPSKITLARIYAARMTLQNHVVDKVPRRIRNRVFTVMALIDDIGMDLRRKEIRAAGARARSPHCRFDGERLGSSESQTFLEGYRSTHPILPSRGVSR
jgi:hypothetical protein